MTELPDDAAREILSMLAGVIEAQQALERKVDQRFDHADQRFDHVDQQFDRMEMRMDRLEGRVDRVEGRLDRIDARIDSLDESVRHSLALTTALAQDLQQHEARHHAA